MDVAGATLASAAMRAGLIDEYAVVTHPVLLGGGKPFFTALDNWVDLFLVETRTFPGGVVLTRYETRPQLRSPVPDFRRPGLAPGSGRAVRERADDPGDRVSTEDACSTPIV